MSLLVEQRQSDSPYVETIMHGHTLGDGSAIRPAETHWHMVFVRQNGKMHPIVVGALTTAGVASWKADAEILWVKFKLGTFIPHLPAKEFLDEETTLPGAASRSFWLKGSAWDFPDYENVETFIDKLVRQELLVCDPLVSAVLQDQPPEMAARTVRHRFLQATGLTQNHIRQVERAQQAARLLQQGIPILDTVYELGYYDQPHLTRSLKQFIGHTPTQNIQLSQPDPATQITLLNPAE